MRVFSMFKSISGEVGAFAQGEPVLFIRLHGCNLNCPYCDAKDACDPNTRNKCKELSVAEIVRKIKDVKGIVGVLITGGEPLIHSEISLLLEILTEVVGLKVAVETNGTIVPTIVNNCLLHYVIDYKGKIINPKSTEVIQSLYQSGASANYLLNNVTIKCVVRNDIELDVALSIAHVYHNSFKMIAISPIEEVSYKHVYDIILNSNIPITLNSQVHKLMKLDEQEITNLLN